jgi:hypothetical protein
MDKEVLKKRLLELLDGYSESQSGLSMTDRVITCDSYDSLVSDIIMIINEK